MQRLGEWRQATAPDAKEAQRSAHVLLFLGG
jgi:hypothetical protein